MNKDLKTEFEVHYYLKGNSHTMNAFVRNKAEKNLLEAIKRIGILLDSEIKLETQAYQEGGLKETILISTSCVFQYLSPAINNIITYFFTRDAEAESLAKEAQRKAIQKLELEVQEKELDLKIKEEQLKKSKLENQEIEERLIREKLNDPLTQKYISNFYKAIEHYDKVEKIGYRSPHIAPDENVVERKDFKNFILQDEQFVSEDDEATIEIISPVLKEGRYNWKGKYDNEKIEFSMADSNFKQEVIDGKYKFSNGSSIYCSVEIKTTLDEFEEKKGKKFRVLKVFEVKESEFEESKPREIGKKHKKQKWLEKHQKSLFDSIEY
ncbi:hypothetical protein [Helicobacter sp. 11S02596-1]|uniref:hypothetical protein n=1 Tax=Helicobacter sp. 11S02596-1 TaxID=1476194 RepID=UPI000BA5BF2C|nr:hypothetical protein [Helicobacter sp. 11S02596-1]